MKKTFVVSMLAVSMVAAASVAMAQDTKPGSTADGAKKAQMCIGCHGMPGYKATFPEVYQVPMISGQNAKYLAAALAAYRKGERRHPSMRAISGSLTDQDIADLAAFYEGHAKNVTRAPDTVAEPNVDVKELLTKGACASCHGPNYSKPIDPSYPKLGGQHADYLFAALRSYKVKGNTHGRDNAIMGAQVKQFDNRQLKAMANYLGSLPAEMQTVPQEKFISRTASAQ
jgi:cytochrome c553